MANNRIGGKITVTVGTDQLSARGDFAVSGFHPVREGVAGQDEVHGYTELPQVPMVEGTITTRRGFNLAAIQGLQDVQVVVALSNGSVYALYEAWETGEGAINTNEGSLPVKFQGMRGEQIQ